MKKSILIASIAAFTVSSVGLANANQGKQIYENGCQTCHAPTIAPALGSPTVHDAEAWAPRLEAAKKAVEQDGQYKTEIDYLVAQVKQGKGAMPPGGMCKNPSAPNDPCSDEDYAAAIQFMISNE